MGARQSLTQQFCQPFESAHPLYWKAKIVKINEKKYIRTNINIQDRTYKAWKNIITDLKNVKGNQFLLLPQTIDFQYGKRCDTNGIAIVNVRRLRIFILTILQTQQNRLVGGDKNICPSNNHSFVSAKMAIKTHGDKIGDIRPANIFIDKDGKLKVLNIFTSPYETTNFQKAKNVGDQNIDLILAPEDLKDLEKNAIDNICNQQSEIFSIGATVLCAGLLDDFSSVFNYLSFVTNQSQLQKRKQKWIFHVKYSEIFKSIILNLLNDNPYSRITIENIYKFISQYDNSILSKSQFIITDPPQIFQKGIQTVRLKNH